MIVDCYRREKKNNKIRQDDSYIDQRKIEFDSEGTRLIWEVSKDRKMNLREKQKI